MSVTKPNLIIFQSGSFISGICFELLDKRWNVHFANSIDQAAKLIQKNKFMVGVCLIENCNDQNILIQINKLFSDSRNIHWILGLPNECCPERSSSPSVNRLISDFCHECIELPVDMARLEFSLGYARGLAEIQTPDPKNTDNTSSCYGIIGESRVMGELFKKLRKVAKEDCSVLIEGETGTGKELIAKAIHEQSVRANQSMTAINCGAFPKELIQAELFGYEKGAFTGAQQRKIGRIEEAQGGTLFLDEIGDLPLEQQINLLRFLEERTINRIGGTGVIPIDVRIIAATHVNLKEAVQKGTFREDLYYRLRVLQLKVPPLRDRGKDIELIAWYFFKKYSAMQNYRTKGFSMESINVLNNYAWPGNVRELMNCIRHAIVMSENRFLTAQDLHLDRRREDRALRTLEEARADADRITIINSLHYSGSNISRAAELLGITRVSLYRLIAKYQLEI